MFLVLLKKSHVNRFFYQYFICEQIDIQTSCIKTGWYLLWKEPKYIFPY